MAFIQIWMHLIHPNTIRQVWWIILTQKLGLSYHKIYFHVISQFAQIGQHYLDNSYVSLRLRVQNAVPAQPCVGKYWISLILLNFLHCNFRLWFKTPQPFDSYPCHASEVTRNTLNHCLKFTVRSIFCHICYGKISEKNVNTFFKVKLFISKTSDSCFKVLICFKCS